MLSEGLGVGVAVGVSVGNRVVWPDVKTTEVDGVMDAAEDDLEAGTEAWEDDAGTEDEVGTLDVVGTEDVTALLVVGGWEEVEAEVVVDGGGVEVDGSLVTAVVVVASVGPIKGNWAKAEPDTANKASKTWTFILRNKR